MNCLEYKSAIPNFFQVMGIDEINAFQVKF